MKLALYPESQGLVPHSNIRITTGQHIVTLTIISIPVYQPEIIPGGTGIILHVLSQLCSNPDGSIFICREIADVDTHRINI
jgi:hypothetical protein